MAEAKKAKEPKKVVPKEVPPLPENMEIPTRRARMLMVNPADFMFLFTKGLRVRKQFELIEGVPEDAKLLTIAAEPVRGGIMMVVESEEYEEIPINVMPPIQMVRINTGKFHTKGATKSKKRK